MKWIKFYPLWICVMLAALLWYVFYLSNTVTLEIKLKVDYKNVPHGYVVTKGSDKVIPLIFNVKGNEVNSLKKSFEDVSLSVDMKQLHVDSILPSQTITYSPALMVKQQIMDYHKNNAVFEMGTDSADVVIERAVAKKLPLIDNFTYSLPQGVMITNNSGLSADSVVVVGLMSDIFDLTAVNTPKKNLGQVWQNVSFTVDLGEELKDVTVIPQKVTYSLSVSQFTENDVKIPLSVENDSCNYEFFPDEIDVKYNVAVKDYGLVSPSMFSVKLDFADNSNMAIVILESSPEFIDIIDISPKYVQYLIFKR
ncbi:MAG: hypothetical protein PHR20_03620 [Bacteroidales bacterium]|nr:hypothetical protein [Bacteroidales bacterium]